MTAVAQPLPAERGLLRRLLSVRNLVLVAVAAAIAYLALVPLGFLLWQTFVHDGTLTVASFRSAYSAVGLGTMTANSLVFAFGSALLSITVGTVLAYLIVRTDVPGKPLMFAASLVPLIIPGIMHGGQQQRLALARALVMEPPLLLLDKPLSNLDAKLREELRFELKRLQRDLGITGVYVTHDQVEALAMSNRVAVMRNGKIEQVGRPRDVYEAPKSRFVADFIGTSNFIDGKIEAKDSGVYRIATADGELRVRSDADYGNGAKVVVAARPEHISLAAGANGGDPNRWNGKVAARAFLGESVDHVVAVGSREIRARCNPTVSIPAGTDVVLTFPEDACSLIPGE